MPEERFISTRNFVRVSASTVTLAGCEVNFSFVADTAGFGVGVAVGFFVGVGVGFFVGVGVALPLMVIVTAFDTVFSEPLVTTQRRRHVCIASVIVKYSCWVFAVFFSVKSRQVLPPSSLTCHW